MAHHDQRSKKWVAFDHGFDSAAVAIDGTWSIKGRLNDISETGAKFSAIDKVHDRIRQDEFFLVLTNDGRVNRRCKIVWENSGCFGLQFVSSGRS